MNDECGVSRIEKKSEKSKKIFKKQAEILDFGLFFC